MSRLRHRLIAHAHDILSLLKRARRKPLCVTARNAANRVTVRVEAAPADAGAAVCYPGRHLSSVELLVWNALADGAKYSKEIAHAIGWSQDQSKLRILLANLEDRGVIVHEERQGYSRADCEQGPRRHGGDVNSRR
jgi:hypothetical protein